MLWTDLLNSTRLVPEDVGAHTSAGRSPFDADVDRVSFSGSFRRLSRKTQVHPLAANDHVHTRLTHSIEVARVGRTLAKRIGALVEARGEMPPERTPHDFGSIVEAACLAHDLGNPAFGHAGEEAMKHWFENCPSKLLKDWTPAFKHDIATVEGNAQGFRIITQTENHLFKGGLKLTAATLGAFLKYPWTTRRPEKKVSAYLTEEVILASVAEKLKLLPDAKGGWKRHPLAFIVEAADDICYAILDLEDAVELRILSFANVSGPLLEALEPDIRSAVERSFEPSDQSFRVNLSRLRGAVFDRAMSGAVESFGKNYELIMTGGMNGSLLDALGADDPRGKMVSDAKDKSTNHVFTDARKVELEIGAYATFDTILSAFCNAAVALSDHLRDPIENNLSWKDRSVLRLLGDHTPSKENEASVNGWTKYQCLRRALDFVSGMTDNYATYIARQFQGSGFSGGQRP